MQLSNVISDITGESGLRIIEAILAGERHPEQLASLCSTRIKVQRFQYRSALTKLPTREGLA
jgi:transposase